MYSDPSNPPNFSTFFDKYKEYLDKTENSKEFNKQSMDN